MNQNTEFRQSATPPPLGDAANDQLSEHLGARELFEALLRQPRELAKHSLIEGRTAIGWFGIIAIVSTLIFGLVLGTFAYGKQIWAAPVKLGGGMLFAALICFPSLYIFSSLAGSRASIAKLASLLSGMLALAGRLLLGFAPAVWIFAQGTSSFGFMGFLAIAAWLVALAFGYRFLRMALRETGAAQGSPLVIWISIFLLVTLQLSTSLRPILGNSEHILTSEKKFFLEHWSDTIGKSLTVAEPEMAEVKNPVLIPSRGEQTNPFTD